tara:strand:- start:59257 stop:59571 length:315 start_codon:yes stop_codon:yes gene_type:complete
MGFFDLFKSPGAKTEELKKIVNDNAFLVDVRSPGEFSSGSAKGAVNIPLDKINGNIDKFKGKENIVVFCRSGNRSGQAKSILEQNGIRNVTNGGTFQQVDNLLN